MFERLIINQNVEVCHGGQVRKVPRVCSRFLRVCPSDPAEQERNLRFRGLKKQRISRAIGGRSE
jgi:hypothetical protein